MNLTLKVISHQNTTLGDAAVKTFDEQGGSFGRSDENAWVIPDQNRVVSGQHGMIFFEDGNFHLMDISKNGIYLNDSSSPLGKGQVTVLQDGDMLLFGDYQVQVCTQADREGISESPLVSGQIIPESSNIENGPGEIVEAADKGNTAEQADHIVQELEEHRAPDYDPLAKFGPGGDSGFPRSPEISSVDVDLTPELSHEGNSPQSSAFNPGTPKVDTDLISESSDRGAREIIPEDWDKTGFGENLTSPDSEAIDGNDHAPEMPPSDVDAFEKQPVVMPGRDPVMQSSKPSNLDAHEAFMKGAGLDRLETGLGSDPLRDMESAGVMFREMVEGLMMLLQSRTELKNQFRMSATTIKPTENNPLKFSPHVDEALKTLFANDRPGFLSGDAAIKEAIGDIRNHQIAMIVAMHSGVTGLLDKLQPRRFENEEAVGLVKSALLSANKKSRAWENFRSYYDRVVVESGDAFQTLCAEEFNDAYNEQLRRLESGKRGSN